LPVILRILRYDSSDSRVYFLLSLQTKLIYYFIMHQYTFFSV